ncbi:hypothetical protein EYZ11_011008 [Aspergillus tanneri]|uniref:Uncharacterized protein n=1 Tax=Aspergillus tanneri TaxID=1220188 RepID=A0A4S3J9B6_9EURO|nr:hypothetical protein EYZ11_011008 [Aspergillus tanneri]
MPEQYIEVEKRITKACETLRRSKKPNIAATAPVTLDQLVRSLLSD